jgi:hypothetical protein
MDDSHDTSLSDPIFDFPPALKLARHYDPGLRNRACTAWESSRRLWQRLIDQGPAVVPLLRQDPDANASALIKEHWRAYWKTRAPFAPISRREQSARVYGAHLQAAAQFAFAEGRLDAGHLKAALSLLDTPEGPLRVDGNRVYVETLALELPGGGSAPLPGALVMSVDNEAPVAQLLYLPGEALPLQVFDDRNVMERDLRGRLVQLWPTEGSDAGQAEFVYTATEKPLRSALNQWMEALLLRFNEALAQDQAAAVQGANTDYRAVEAVERECRERFFFAPAPVAWGGPDMGETGPLLSIGGLAPSTAFEARHAALQQQRTMIEAWLQGDDDGAERGLRLENLQQASKTLEQAQSAARAAITGLVARDSLTDLLALRIDTDNARAALYAARLQGLRAELGLQTLLAGVPGQELAALNAWLQAPPSAPVTISALTLLASEEGDGDGPHAQELYGPLLIECPHTDCSSADSEHPADPTDDADNAAPVRGKTPGALWLYWPGRDGGLQRFATFGELQRALFKGGGTSSGLRIERTLIAADALDYSLQNQLYACEQAAVAQLALGGDASADARELNRLRLQALDDWGVAHYQARDLALAEVVEQERAESLEAVLPDWLRRQSPEQREQLHTLAHDYRAASARALEVLAQALPSRATFAEQAVQGWLRQRFGDDGDYDYQVVIDLPQQVDEVLEVSGDPAYGATVEKRIKKPSEARTRMALTTLALANIDAQMEDRLLFMTLEVTGGTEAGRQFREAAIDKPWLQQCVKALDLADAYEKRLRAVFMGSDGQLPFVNAYRRECLLEPHRLIVRSQALRGGWTGKLDDAAALMVNAAIDADNGAARHNPAQRIVLRGATLSAGGSDTEEAGTTLSGITFIEDQNSGLTVLVLPDSPDDQWLRQYPTITAARDALFALSLQARFADYLAGRALVGDAAAHLARLKEAHLKGFSLMIGIGAAWSPSTSLASHLLDAHMGRLIQAHRDTSRSNTDLYLEQAALKGAMLLVYIKMAVGVLPFVGTAVGLYDAWESANEAVDAFLREESGRGLGELRNVLIAVLDAVMDFLPGGAPAAQPGAARLRVRQRQQRGTARGLLPMQRVGGVSARAFAGYETSKVISLSPVELGTQGIYRQVYRHAEGNFILREGRLYAVELTGSPRTWRLSGNASKTYRQPIALDEAGQWQSHGALYGTLVNGGLPGGGGVLGHLADGADPYWPAAIRERLPRWWSDRVFRRQDRLLSQAQRAANVAEERVVLTRELMRTRVPTTDVAELLAAFQQVIETSINAFEQHLPLLDFAHGRKATVVRANLSRSAMLVTESSIHQVSVGKAALAQLTRQIDHITDTLLAGQLDHALIRERLNARGLLSERRAVMMQRVEAAATRVDQWEVKVTTKENKHHLAGSLAPFRETHLAPFHTCLTTLYHVDLTLRFRPAHDLLEWLRFGVRTRPARNSLSKALFSHQHLLDVRPTPAQRKRLLEQCIDAYHQARQQLRVWEAGDGEFVDADYFEALMANLQRNIEDAQAWIGKVPERRAPTAIGASKRVFETADDQLLVGVEVPEGDVAVAQLKVKGADGQEDVYRQGAAGKWQLQPPTASVPVPTLPVKQIKRQAQARVDRLPAYRAKVDQYAGQGMGGKSLEDMLGSEARELSGLARKIEAQEPGAPLITVLDDSAASLHQAGKAVRIDTTLTTRQPTEGDLQYLLDQRLVAVRKVGERVELRKRPDGRRDFLQEYEVRRLDPDEPLWYAHFHYDQAGPAGFDGFVAAHLKTPAQRYIGRQWQGAPGAVEPWRGAIGRVLAGAYFASL